MNDPGDEHTDRVVQGAGGGSRLIAPPAPSFEELKQRMHDAHKAYQDAVLVQIEAWKAYEETRRSFARAGFGFDYRGLTALRQDRDPPERFNPAQQSWEPRP